MSMADLSEPVNFKTPHYMFYENNRGFHFRCLESLFREGVLIQHKTESLLLK